MGNTKYKVIIGFLVVLLAAALCAICFLLGRESKKEEIPDKEAETKEVEKKEEQNEKEKDEEKEETSKETPKKEEKEETKEYKIKEVLFDTTSYGNDDVEKVELTTDGTVLVTIKGTDNDVTREEVAKDVTKTFTVRVGQADICEGNKRIMFVHKDGTASYINIDQLTCGQSIVVEKLNGYKNIDRFEEKTVKYDGEPDEHITYVITKDGKKTDITAKIS